MHRIIKLFKKETYLIPMIVCLFFLPIFFNPFFVLSFTQGKEIFFKIILLLWGLTSVILLIIRGEFRFKPLLNSKLFQLLSALAFIVLIADAASPTPIVSIYGIYTRGFGLIIQLFIAVFALICALKLNKKNIVFLLKFIFVSGLIVSIYALLQQKGYDLFFSNFDTDVFVGRVFSFLGNPGYLGQFLILEIIIGCYLLNISKNRIRIFYGIALAANFAALYFTQTRTALLGLFICLLMIIIKNFRKIFKTISNIDFKKKIIAGLIICLSLAVIVFALPKDRFSLSENSVRSLNSRFQTWSGAIQLISERPIFGYGGDTFYIYAPEIITKTFLTLEENLSLNIDRIHNEFLEFTFSYGVIAGLLYILIFLYVVRLYFKSKDKVASVLALLIIANFIQDQFSFADITISVLIAFSFGGLIAIEADKFKEKVFKIKKFVSIPLILLSLLLAFLIGYNTIFNPVMSQVYYTKSKNNYSTSYDIAVLSLKKTISYTPYYSELWYELMMIDSSSMARALTFLPIIEGESGNVLAWKGNLYSSSDPQKSSEYFIKALEKNPLYPNWIRAFADMLYKNGDLPNALFLYDKYLEAVPEFWKWRDTLSEKTPEEQKSYRIFFKNVPDFWKTVDRVNEINRKLSGEE